MKNIMAFSVIFLLTIPAFAQSSVNIYKNSVLPKVNVVNSTDVALPFNQKQDIDLASENYHNAVLSQDNDSENGKAAEISADATKNAQNNSSIKKEAFVIGNPPQAISTRPKQKQVEIKAVGTKQ